MTRSDGEAGAILLTGCTGFLGRRILYELAPSGTQVFVLAEQDELPRAHATVARVTRRIPRARGRLTLFTAELGQPGLGLEAGVADRILAEADRFVHTRFVAAAPNRRPDQAAGANVRAVEGLLGFAHRSKRLRVFAMASSVAVSGDYPGTFYEDWLDVGQAFADPLDRAVYEMEARVRHARRTLPVVVVRTGILVGDSETGEVERDAGLGPLVHALAALRVLPRWLPLPGPEGERRVIPVSPVDYVARGLLAIAETRECYGWTFCLTDPDPPTLRVLLDMLADELGAPRIRYTPSREWQARALLIPGLLPSAVRLGRSWGLPVSALRYLAGRNRHDAVRGTAATGRLGIVCPPFASYFRKLVATHLRDAA